MQKSEVPVSSFPDELESPSGDDEIEGKMQLFSYYVDVFQTIDDSVHNTDEPPLATMCYDTIMEIATWEAWWRPTMIHIAMGNAALRGGRANMESVKPSMVVDKEKTAKELLDTYDGSSPKKDVLALQAIRAIINTNNIDDPNKWYTDAIQQAIKASKTLIERLADCIYENDMSFNEQFNEAQKEIRAGKPLIDAFYKPYKDFLYPNSPPLDRRFQEADPAAAKAAKKAKEEEIKELLNEIKNIISPDPTTSSVPVTATQASDAISLMGDKNSDVNMRQKTDESKLSSTASIEWHPAVVTAGGGGSKKQTRKKKTNKRTTRKRYKKKRPSRRKRRQRKTNKRKQKHSTRKRFKKGTKKR